MNLIALGISHHSASIEVRERVAFAPEQVGEALVDLCRSAGVEEAVILSTCNRTELYAVAPAPLTAAALIEWVAGYHHLSAEELAQCAYRHQDGRAVQHLVEVASGLDSMVLGEPQIFGQMKSAYAVASEAGTVGSELDRLFQRVFAVAKRVRTDTAIGENPVSVAYAAVDLAGHIFSDLAACNALLVGAGETVELVARHLVDAGVPRIVIANRTLGRARELAQQFGAEAVLLADIPEQLVTADIVITSTASQLPLLGKGAVEHALKQRKHRPFLMVDIAVPRDIEPQVAELRDVYLYSVDDLQEIVEQNMRHRHTEARKADVIIAEAVDSYQQEVRALGAVDTVKRYRTMAEQTREQELQRALRALDGGAEPATVLAQLARGITNKLIHSPTAGLKRASAQGRNDLLQQAVSLLGLEAPAERVSVTEEKTAADADDATSAQEAPTPTIENTPRTLQ
ncbi:MAG: glutamyl-tRNA reductase [Pseudomonadota bacterium]